MAAGVPTARLMKQADTGGAPIAVPLARRPGATLTFTAPHTLAGPSRLRIWRLRLRHLCPPVSGIRPMLAPACLLRVARVRDSVKWQEDPPQIPRNMDPRAGA